MLETHAFSKRYLVTFFLSRSFVVVVVVICLISGIFSPVLPFPHAPSVQSAVLSQKKVLQAKTDPVTSPQTQVSVVAIGEKKSISPTPTQSVTEEKPATRSVARQLDEHTWTMSVEKDERMASAHEIFEALNTYRQKKGRQALSWDSTLATYAQSRADLFAQTSNTDKHAGFTDFINNQDGFSKLGFNAIGENSSYGYQLLGVHLIEVVYAGDAPHDDNQLRDSWSHVGIGVQGLATNLVFAGSKR